MTHAHVAALAILTFAAGFAGAGPAAAQTVIFIDPGAAAAPFGGFSAQTPPPAVITPTEQAPRDPFAAILDAPKPTGAIQSFSLEAPAAPLAESPSPALTAQPAAIRPEPVQPAPAAPWSAEREAEAVAALGALEPTGLRAADALALTILRAPIRETEGEALRAARLAALRRFGDMSEFDRQGGEAAAPAPSDGGLCADSPDEAAQREAALIAYCLAQSGAPGAGVVLRAARERGAVDGVTAGLIEAMIDPGLAPYVEKPEPGAETPLQRAAMQAAGLLEAPLPPPDDQALFADPQAVAEARLEAAERLEMRGLIAAATLRDFIYETEPEGVDGAWRRAAAIRSAKLAPSAAKATAALRRAAEDGAATYGMLARAIAPLIRTLSPPPEEAAADKALMRDALLLAGETAAAWRWRVGGSTFEDALFVLAGSGFWSEDMAGPLAEERQDSDIALAALRGVTAPTAADAALQGAAIDAAGSGEPETAALLALTALRSGDAEAFAAALFALRQAGRESDARMIALEALIVGADT